MKRASDLFRDHEAEIGVMAQSLDVSIAKAKALSEASSVVREALALLRRGEGDRAIWRLVDAAGTLSEHFPVSSGTTEFTGLGFRLELSPTRRRAIDCTEDNG